MVLSCSDFACTNRWSKESKLKYIQFHRFSLNKPELLQKWVKMIKRKDFIPTKYYFICSEHFIPEDYQIRPAASVRLSKEDVYPRILNGFPKYLQEKMPVKRRLLNRNEEEIERAGEKYLLTLYKVPAHIISLNKLRHDVFSKNTSSKLGLERI
ncbi:unnamed protein product [Macrosiphum euphorbiae]|uniref:THAP-type domain-containing protein n=1 Tax=Macrosiphum euphorbiae TaxID=13131 RepID=A0AAV0WHG9_9HEMI|nr:unnamed protein product [Macrosiphum euphorbiae]